MTKEETTPLEFNLAPFPTRVLAAFIDYLILNILSNLCITLTQISRDFHFIPTFTLALLYYSIANSELLSGQTLGKKVFGLKVLNSKLKNKDPFIGITQAIIRFFFSFGIIILLAEVPPLVYRMMIFRSSEPILELHMLCSMLFFLFNFAVMLTNKKRFGLHDILSSSIVVRADRNIDFSSLQTQLQKLLDKIPESKILNQKSIIAIALAFFVWGYLWSSSLSNDPIIKDIRESRYVLENNFRFRIEGVSSLPKNETISLDISIPSLEIESKTLVGSLSKNLEKNYLGANSKYKKLRYRLYYPASSLEDSIQILEVELDKFQIKEIDPTENQPFGIPK